MMFKNSFRLFCANFDKVWKLLVYQILCWAITAALLAPFYKTITSCFVGAWNKFELSSFFANGTFYGLNIVVALNSFVSAAILFISNLFTANIFCAIYFLVILFYVRPFLGNLGKYTVCEMMYGYMASSSKISFTGTLLRTLKRSLPYAALKTLYTLPFDAMILASLYGISRVTFNEFKYILPIIIVLMLAILLALRQLFIAGWAPSSIVFAQNPVTAYKRGMVAVFRRGFRVYSSALVAYILTFTLAMVIGIYSLIIILPCVFPLLDIFDMVVFFSSQGMRFYVDADTILSPKKLEEVDTIKKAKYLL